MHRMFKLRRRGDPRLVPCFRPYSVSTCCPLGSREVHRLHVPSSFTYDTGLRPKRRVSALPTSHTPILVGEFISGLTYGSLSLRPVDLLAPLVGADQAFPRPTEAFTSGLSTAWSPAPSPDITTGATGQAPLTGLSPVRTPTSIAATAHRTRTGGFPASGSRKRLTHAPTEGPRYGAVTGPNRTQNEETLPGTACIPAALHGVCRRATDAACGGPVGRPRCRLC